MLCLNETEISQAAELEDITAAVEAALILYEKKEFKMPMRMHADYRGNTLLLMPCFTKERFSTKLVSLFPENVGKNLPVLMGTVILNDGKTGEPLALLNGAKLTALRTGAVGGVGVRYLTSPDVQSLGIVGAGVQGLHQALFACRERPISRVFVYDQLPEKAYSLIQKLANLLPGVTIYQANSGEELLKECELIITATNATEPVFPDNRELLRGKHFIGIGSYKPDMREFPESLFKLLDEIFVDTEHAAEESGDLIDPLKYNWLKREQVLTLGKLIMGKKKIKPASGKTILFKSVGMALFDLMAADLIYQKALQKDLGTRIEL